MRPEKNPKIFVAGGTGMVGSSIIRKLPSKGYTNIVSNYHRRKPKEDYGVMFYPLDLRRQEETEKFFEKERPDYVFMASAKVGGILANNTYKAEFIYDNLAIALNVIHSSYKYGIKKLLNPGSSCIYLKHARQPMKEEYLLTGALGQNVGSGDEVDLIIRLLSKGYKPKFFADIVVYHPDNYSKSGINRAVYYAAGMGAVFRKNFT